MYLAGLQVVSALECKPTACQSNHDEHIVFVNLIVRPANGYDAGGVDSYSTALNDRVD